MHFAPDQTPDSSGIAGSTGTGGAAGLPGPAATEQPTQPPSTPTGPAGEERLHRVARGRMLGGVATGVADYFDVDPTIVRIAFVGLAFLGGLAVPLYLAGWLLIPDEDTDMSVAEELLAHQRAHSAF